MRMAGVTMLLLLCSVPSVWADAPSSAPDRVPELKLALDVTLTSVISVEVLKRTFKDPRPDGSDYGFPSGHTSLAFALARVASEYHPKQRDLWYLLAAAVAYSRVREGAHDWDDVIGGAALGSCLGDRAVENGGLILAKCAW